MTARSKAERSKDLSVPLPGLRKTEFEQPKRSTRTPKAPVLLFAAVPIQTLPKYSSRRCSGMERNIISTTVCAGVMLSFSSHSRVMPRVP